MKKLVKRIINYTVRTALDVYRQTNQSSSAYTLTFNSYKPWLNDKEFLNLTESIREKTLLDEYRLYEIYSLTKQCSKLDGNMFEVGVYKGGSGALISLIAKKLGKHVYLADTFRGVVKAGEFDSCHKDGDFSDTSLITVDNYLKGLALNNYTLLEGIFPEDTSNLIPTSEKFCFCHIDVDVYLSAKHVVEWIWDRLVVGGVIVFDDYGFVQCDGITKYVNDELSKDPRAMFVFNLNSHAVVVKIAN